MDITDPCGTPIRPIGDGTVAWVKYLDYGYGHHVLITNSEHVQSLYAHMSDIFVKEGDHVTRTTQIGVIGLTGNTTGCHVHVEVYVDGTVTNPLDVLPDLKDVSLTGEVQR